MRKGDAFALIGIIVVLPIVGLIVFAGDGVASWISGRPSAADAPYVSACEGAMRGQLTQPATFERKDSNVEVLKAGMVMTHIRFSAANAFGAVGHYSGLCINNGASTTATMSVDTGG